MKHLSLEQQTLLALCRASLWGEAVTVPEGVNWQELEPMAQQQAVIAFAYDGAMAAGVPVPAELLAKWKKHTMVSALKGHKLLQEQTRLIRALQAERIPVAVLKGTSAAAAYPKPNLRMLGDIDLLVEREILPKTQEVLENLGYSLVEAEHDFHVAFGRDGISVEVHFKVTQLPDSPCGRAAEEVTAGFLQDICTGSLSGQAFPMLSAPNQALSLVLHKVRHLIDSGIGLRQLLDWAAYLTGAEEQELVETTLPMLERCGLKQFTLCATRVCTDYLGLPERYAPWCREAAAEDAAALMEEIFLGGNMGRAGTQRINGLAANNQHLGEGDPGGKAMVAKACQAAYSHFPWAEKCKIALPFLWLFMAVRYAVRAMLGLRPKKTVAGVLNAAKQQQSLYQKLRLFEE